MEGQQGRHVQEALTHLRAQPQPMPDVADTARRLYEQIGTIYAALAADEREHPGSGAVDEFADLLDTARRALLFRDGVRATALRTAITRYEEDRT